MQLVDVVPEGFPTGLRLPQHLLLVVVVREPAHLLALVFRVEQKGAKTHGNVVIGEEVQEVFIEFKRQWELAQDLENGMTLYKIDIYIYIYTHIHTYTSSSLCHLNAS